MPLTKRYETKLEVLPDGRLQQRIATIIEEDEQELSRTYHRKVIDVGDDVSGEDELTQQVAGAVHTQARIAARAAVKAAEATAMAEGKGEGNPNP